VRGGPALVGERLGLFRTIGHEPINHFSFRV
jgi:hypothetical protein